ncbi:pyridoxal phosphate-dependent aminotransferase [Actinoallomurus iriomotensis]|nr:pyridoxal phosphate-dependent aminotransferase [Actinoallomurus iriomotensis]
MGQTMVNLGLGEARLPVHPALLERLAAAAPANSYGPVAGTEPARRAAAGYFTRRRLPTSPTQIVMGPGSKPVLFALLTAIRGDVILPRPCWMSYAAQTGLAGHRAIRVPVPPRCGGVPDPVALQEMIKDARSRGHHPRVLVLTNPDNPTGTSAGPDIVRQVCEIAGAEDLVVISDEIYRDIPHDPALPQLSPAEVLPARTVVLTGLSKSLALGGWRIGLARFPAGEWGRRLHDQVVAIASEMWSSVAAPMQEVAAYALSEPPEIVDHLEASARLHASVATAAHHAVTMVKARCEAPQGGFYVYPDLEPARAILAAKGITGAPQLESHLLRHYGIAVLGGHHFGDRVDGLRFRAATSQLYGANAEEQWAALRDPDPASLPYVAKQLDLLRCALIEMTEEAMPLTSAASGSAQQVHH